MIHLEVTADVSEQELAQNIGGDPYDTAEFLKFLSSIFCQQEEMERMNDVLTKDERRVIREWLLEMAKALED